MGKFIKQFPVMVGCKLTDADAAKLADLVYVTGLKKGVLVRELVRRARVEDLAAQPTTHTEVTTVDVR